MWYPTDGVRNKVIDRSIQRLGWLRWEVHVWQKVFTKDGGSRYVTEYQGEGHFIDTSLSFTAHV